MTRPGVTARRQEGHRRDEQALHAGGSREAARLAAADPAHLGAGRQVLPDLLRGTPRRRSRQRRWSQIPDASTFVPLDQPQRLADEIAEFAASVLRRTEQTFPKNFAKCIFFVRRAGGIFTDPLQDGELMSKQIFDQDRPRSTMAQRLDEAFAGCDEWTVDRRTQSPQQPRLQPHRRRRRADLRRRGAAADRGSRSGLAPSSLAISEEEKPSAVDLPRRGRVHRQRPGFRRLRQESKSHRESHLCHKYANGENDEELPFSH